jgi:DNA-binding LacI/PurR family transcriptional regulator
VNSRENWPLSKRVTLKQVAGHAGVSYQTVSRVINNKPDVAPETRVRVQAAIEALDYTPRLSARALYKQHTSVVGVVMPVAANTLFSDSHLLQILSGVVQEVALRDCSLLISTPYSEDTTPLSACNRLLQERVADGVIVEGGMEKAGVQLLVDEGYSVVVVGYNDYGIPCVHPDDEGGAYGLTQHLLALNHRHIGVIGGPDCPAMQARWRGYARAFHDVGLDYNPDLAVTQDDSTVECGYQGAAQLMQQPDLPTAIFAFSGRMALGSIRWLLERDCAIPDEISIACFDDIANVEFFGVPITTVRLFSADLGRRAAALLFDLIDGNTPTAKEIVLPSRLMARCSTGSAPMTGPSRTVSGPL